MSTSVRTLALGGVLLLSMAANQAVSQVIPFDSDRWEISGATSVQMEYNGQAALFLKGASAVIRDDIFENGVVEFDIAFSGQRGFSGLFWRLQENGDREEFYFRPHQSGNPDANQYNPVLNHVAGWQLYYGPSYAAPITYRYNEWMHVRVVFSESVADIFVDSEKPVLSVHLKNPKAAGQIGIYASNFAPAYFANFQYERLEEPVATGSPVAEPAAHEGAIFDWAVSSPFGTDVIETLGNLDPAFVDTLSWEQVQAESTGTLNLARYAAFARDHNTVLVKTTIEAGDALTRLLRFGYSDRASVYLNGHLLYRGTNDYLSRDYRYLGTMGLFDAVPLRLEPGVNELVFAVSESFGGWGLSAAVE